MIDGQKIMAICASELHNEETQRFILPLYQYFYQHGWKVIVYSCCTNLFQKTAFDCGEASVFRLINYDMIDAVLFFGQELKSAFVINEIISNSLKKGIPVLIVDDTDIHDGCLNISFEGDEAFRSLVKHLITEHKFTKINCIAGHKDSPVSERRLAIFRSILKEYDIPFDENTQLGYGDFYSVPTRYVLRRFLKSPDGLPEAIVCLNDSMAIIACEYLSEHGIKVPEQIVVTGFDGTEHEQYCFPRLTTCRCDMMGFAEFLYDKINTAADEKNLQCVCKYPFSLDISESCGCRSCTGTNVLKSINILYAQMSGSINYDQSMNHMMTKLTGEKDNEKIKRILKKYIQFDSYVCMNTDFCAEERVLHECKANPFTDEMISFRFFFGDEGIQENRFERSQLIPEINMLLEKNEPLIVYAIHNQQNVYGYMAAFAGDFKYSVRRMQKFVMCLNNCVSMYEQQFYLHLSNKKLQQIQNKIIHSFADLVESRDDSTGHHIKRTGEYVRVLVEHLSKLPQYKETLTPEMQQRIYEAAPLHDIGKIKISDMILNKPGRLTPDEFEIIKTHTLEGSEIIEKTLTNIENEDYLKIANEMALYHHEKWDGSGYLYHLAGEDIPLCARIMAVVDVFDALTSKRVYKDAFSFEEAIEILKESRGTHFDPTIIDVFLSIQDDIHKILDENCDAV